MNTVDDTAFPSEAARAAAQRLVALPPDLEERVLAQTIRRVRRRVYVRWGVRLAAATVLFVGGFGSGYRARDVGVGSVGDSAAAPKTEGIGEGAFAPALTARHRGEETGEDVREAAELAPDEVLYDIVALDGALEAARESDRPRILKRAGDRCLEEYRDVAQALVFYRLWLNMVPRDKRLERSMDDSWLLASIKDARRMEAGHEAL